MSTPGPLLSGNDCEVCTHSRSNVVHQNVWAKLGGHQFVPHLKHKMKLYQIKENRFLRAPHFMYVFQCRVCGYKHQCLKTDFHRTNVVSWPNFDAMFDGLKEAFTGIGATYGEVLDNLEKDPNLRVRKPNG